MHVSYQPRSPLEYRSYKLDFNKLEKPYLDAFMNKISLQNMCISFR